MVPSFVLLVDRSPSVMQRCSNILFNKLYKYCSVLTGKSTHQGRVNAQQELENAGVDPMLIKRMCDYLLDAQNTSYLLDLVVDGYVSRAGHDHLMKGSAYSPHISVDASAAVKLLIPSQVAEEDKLEVALAQCEGNREEAKRDRLFCAAGVLQGTRLMWETFIKCAAARPRTQSGEPIKDGIIMKDSPPIHQLFEENNRLFSLPFFSTPEFELVKSQVRAAEDSEISNSSGIGGCPSTGQFSPYEKRILDFQRAESQRNDQKLNKIMDMLQNDGHRSIVPVQFVQQHPQKEASSPSKQTHKSKQAQAAASSAIAKEKGKDHFRYVLQEVETVARLWEEYKTGLEGWPSVSSMEAKDKSWRKYKGGKVRSRQLKRCSENGPL